ncbi:MAG: rhodanese-like domain-containing protein [Lachnospiraceae bacterium]|nr:rhodanese-like domain-containing protein [Lachnospiraceae bacterium]
MSLFHVFGKRTNDINAVVENLKNEPSAKLIDVRDPDEYRTGHIPGSVNIPISRLADFARAAEDKSVPVYTYCLTGMRSGRACAMLRKLGFENVTNAGGIQSYKGVRE